MRLAEQGKRIVGVLREAVGEIESRDVAFVFGLACLAWGAGQVYAPLGFIVPGAIITAVSVFGVR